MNLLVRGNYTSSAEITHVSAHGIWLLSSEKELFMAYAHFPFFKNQPISAILHVEEVSPGHFYWPDIDVDLTQEIIENPERFSLLASER
jgi:hypothetical protein